MICIRRQVELGMLHSNGIFGDAFMVRFTNGDGTFLCSGTSSCCSLFKDHGAILLMVQFLNGAASLMVQFSMVRQI
jgi:hypothetical protein